LRKEERLKRRRVFDDASSHEAASMRRKISRAVVLILRQFIL